MAQVASGYFPKVYKRRWVMLGLFSSVITINFTQFLQYTVLTNRMAKSYDSDVFFDLTGYMFLVIYLLAFWPVCCFIKKFSLKTAFAVGALFTSVGILLKIIVPGLLGIVVCQGLICLAQVFLILLPSRVSSSWFPSNQVFLANGVIASSAQIGLAVGVFLPPLVASDFSRVTKSDGLVGLHCTYGISSGLLFVLILLFFRSNPEQPPSVTEKKLSEKNPDPNLTYWKVLKELFKILCVFGITNGLWISSGAKIVSFHLSHYFANSWKIYIQIMFMLIGCFGTILLGYFLDKTLDKPHYFRKIYTGLLCFSTVAFFRLHLAMHFRSGECTYFAFPLFGFAITTLQMLSWNLTSQLTYPTSEIYSCSILNAIIFFGALVLTIVSVYLTDYFGAFVTPCILTGLLVVCACGIFIPMNLKRQMANKQFD